MPDFQRYWIWHFGKRFRSKLLYVSNVMLGSIPEN